MIMSPIIQPVSRFMILNTKLFHSSVVWNRFFRDICGICAHCFPGWSTQLWKNHQIFGNYLRAQLPQLVKSSLLHIWEILFDQTWQIPHWPAYWQMTSNPQWTHRLDIVVRITRIPRVPFSLDISEMRPHIWQKYEMSFQRQLNSRCLEGDWSPTQKWELQYRVVCLEMHLDKTKNMEIISSLEQNISKRFGW